MTVDNLPLQAAILASRNVDLMVRNAALSAVANEQRAIIGEQSAALRELRETLVERDELIASLLGDRLDRDGNNEAGALGEASQPSLEHPYSADHAPGPVQVVRS